MIALTTLEVLRFKYFSTMQHKIKLIQAAFMHIVVLFGVVRVIVATHIKTMAVQ